MRANTSTAPVPDNRTVSLLRGHVGVHAIAESARAALQSLNEFIRVQQAGRTPLLSDELMHKFLVHRHALRELMISAGFFDQHRVTVFPLEGPAHAALLILAAEVGAAGDSLPPQIEAFAVRLTEVVRVLEGLKPDPTSSNLDDLTPSQVARGFTWYLNVGKGKKERPHSSKVIRLGLDTNGQRGRSLRISRRSVMEYARQEDLEWDEKAATGG